MWSFIPKTHKYRFNRSAFILKWMEHNLFVCAERKAIESYERMRIITCHVCICCGGWGCSFHLHAFPFPHWTGICCVCECERCFMITLMRSYNMCCVPCQIEIIDEKRLGYILESKDQHANCCVCMCI